MRSAISWAKPQKSFPSVKSKGKGSPVFCAPRSWKSLRAFRRSRLLPPIYRPPKVLRSPHPQMRPRPSQAQRPWVQVLPHPPIPRNLTRKSPASNLPQTPQIPFLPFLKSRRLPSKPSNQKAASSTSFAGQASPILSSSVLRQTPIGKKSNASLFLRLSPAPSSTSATPFPAAPSSPPRAASLFSVPREQAPPPPFANSSPPKFFSATARLAS